MATGLQKNTRRQYILHNTFRSEGVLSEVLKIETGNAARCLEFEQVRQGKQQQPQKKMLASPPHGFGRIAWVQPLDVLFDGPSDISFNFHM